MDVSSALRRVKRQFGDEYNVIIVDQDIYDWFYDAELDIIRATSDNDITLIVPASKFPLQVPGRVNLKRISINNKALTYLTVNELDQTQSFLNTSGTPSYWYFQGGQAGLWPVPSSSDKYNVDVTYSKTPAQMTVVAPYLQWISYPAATQYVSVPNDSDWQLLQCINVLFDLAIDNVGITMGLLSGPLGAPSVQHFAITFLGGSIVLSVSNGTTLSSHTLPFLEPVVPGIRFKTRVTFDNTTDTAKLYKTNSLTGEEILQSQHTNSVVFNKQTAAPNPLYMGGSDGSGQPIPGPSMRIYSVELRSSPQPLGGVRVFYFNGEKDLAELYDVDTTFATSDGHNATTFGGVIVPADNVFTVPEVYHEDIVKYALAKAHNKNMNFRAAEAEMEQYDQRVSTRRHEAQSIDGPVYKAPDPFDYADY